MWVDVVMAKLPPPDPRRLKALPLIEDGISLYRQGRAAEAEDLFRQALKKVPDQPDALFFLGLLKIDQRNPADALKLMMKAIKIAPRFAEAHFVSGSILNMLGRPQDAVAAYSRAIAIKPDHVNALNDLGNTWGILGRPDDAIAAYDKAIAAAPGAAMAYNNKGAILAEAKRFGEAIANYDRALALKPDYAEAHNNRGAALLVLSRPDQALASLEQALALRPDYAEAINNKGTALQDLNRHQEALGWHQRALGLNPHNANAHLNIANAYLALGQYEQGWAEYEWRWGTKDLAPFRRQLRCPQWLGDQPLEKKSILLYAEQGYGDMLQFARYVPMVAKQGARVVLEVPRPLFALFGSLAGVSNLVCRGDKLPPSDFHCPLLSLPRALRTSLHTIPADTPYLRAPPDHSAKWKERIAGHGGRKIGLAWSGRPYPRNRSIPLAALESLFSLPDVTFVSLQQEFPEGDLALLAGQSNVLHFGTELKDFADTAGVVSCLDLVLSVDSSVAHLAGAMGKPLWLLLLFASDFRWLVERDDNPWYPTARLFRQTKIGDWDTVVHRVRRELCLSSASSTPAASSLVDISPDIRANL
jgi:tetratricopeptide (TPR) repeat protein